MNKRRARYLLTSFPHRFLCHVLVSVVAQTNVKPHVRFCFSNSAVSTSEVLGNTGVSQRNKVGKVIDVFWTNFWISHLPCVSNILGSTLQTTRGVMPKPERGLM